MYKPVTYNGVEYGSMKELAKSYGIRYETFLSRLRAGMDMEDALMEPSCRNKKVTCRGREYPSITALAAEENVPIRLLLKFYADCGDIEEALEKSHERKRETIVIWGKEYKDHAAAALAFGLSPDILRRRFRTEAGPPEEIVEKLLDQGVEFEGKPYGTLSELCMAYNIQPFTLHCRLRSGWTLSDAVTVPINRTSSGISTTYDGVEYRSRIELCRSYGVSYHWVNKNRRKFENWLDAFTFAVRLKKEIGFRDDEMFTSVPGCIM